MAARAAPQAAEEELALAAQALALGAQPFGMALRERPPVRAAEAAARVLEVLAEQVDIVMPRPEWEAFCKALDAPPRSIPALKKLLTEASVFDGPAKAAAR